MNVALRPPPTDREQFLLWVQGQEGRFEFDGQRPVRMTGGTLNHGLIFGNILLALRTRLRGSVFLALGPDNGVATSGGAVRYPDVLVTSRRGGGGDLLIGDVVVVVEVVSPGNERTDRVVKLREYLAVPSIRRYVIVEQAASAVTMFERAEDGRSWRATAVTGEEVLAFPELGIEVPVDEFYENVELPGGPS